MINPYNEEKSLSVLHLEDDKVDTMVIERIIKRHLEFATLYHAKDGFEAFDMLRGENGKNKIPRPNIILLDLNMPKMNGHEFLKALRQDEEFKPISVFVLTTSNDEYDKQTAFSYNVAGYILKPISVEQFELVFRTLASYWKLNQLV
jgi:CheY-like chemotaxis protein